MSNENHASYTKIGLTVILGIAAIVATLIYLGGIRGEGDVILAETYYDKSVNGLSVGSAVNFRGVKIGEVREISFVGSKYDVKGPNNSRIYILMALNRNFFGLKEEMSVEAYSKLLVDKLGLRATVTASGITGLSRIECDYNPVNPPKAPEVSWQPKNFYIPPKISLLDSFSDSATKVMNQINRIDISVVWSNMNAIVESLSAMSESTRNLIDSRQGELDKLLVDLSDATSAAKTLIEKLRDNPSLIIREQVVSPLPETSR